MNNIPFVTSDRDLVERIEQLLGSGSLFGFDVLEDVPKAIEHLSVEMPELVFLNFSDGLIDAKAFLGTLKSDPWLLHGGVIAFCETYDEAHKLERSRGANVIAVLCYKDISLQLPRVIEIIQSNRRILFQREIGADIVGNISGSFRLENDFTVASCYVNLVCNFLYNANRLNAEKRVHLNLALNELLINAIEHGNCGITYAEKTAWLEQEKPISGLIAQKCSDPKVGARKVTFEYRLGPTSSHFTIADEGDGFDWRNIKDASESENLYKLHGRGILVSRQVTDNLTFNEKGNEVQFEITYEEDEGEIKPGLFENIEPTHLRAGQTVFSEGESSDFLYYIVKGHYDIVVNETTVSTLTPDDIFMGEMSFLLNNRRSAMVRASTDGVLIMVSKKQFVGALKRKPHYALFLCRLLAQRIQRSNLKSAIIRHEN